MALVSYHAREGDLLYALFGDSVLCVLRPKEDNSSLLASAMFMDRWTEKLLENWQAVVEQIYRLKELLFTNGRTGCLHSTQYLSHIQPVFKIALYLSRCKQGKGWFGVNGVEATNEQEGTLCGSAGAPHVRA